MSQTTNLNLSRVTRIYHATSLEDASRMGLLDRIIDWFKSGVKKTAIEAAYKSITDLKTQRPDQHQRQIASFLELRDWVRPEHKQKFDLGVSDHADGSCDYTLRIDGREIYQANNVVNVDDLAFIRGKKQSLDVDNYLLTLQGNHPDAIGLIKGKDEFTIRQQAIKDCYALAVMIGVLSNPASRDKIDAMASITTAGDFRLTVKPDRYEDISTRFDRCLSDLLSSASELSHLKKKGYDISQHGEDIQITISKSKMEDVISNQASARTNSLLVNVMEHLVGNLIGQPDNNRLARRNSITAHNTKTGNYHPLVGNLMGYKHEPHQAIYQSTDLVDALKHFEKNKKCISQGGDKGFVYVSYLYGDKRQDGTYAGGHALVLNKVVYDRAQMPFDETKDRNILGIELINPHDNQATEYIALDTLIDRRISFHPYSPRDLQVDPPRFHTEQINVKYA